MVAKIQCNNKLKGKIKEVYGTQAKFAEALKISTVSLSAKLNCKIGWKQNEMARAAKLLGIKGTQIYSYFFLK